MTGAAESVRYRFSDATRAGVLLGLSLRQAMPLVVGIGWLTLWLAAGQPVVGMCGVAAGCAIAFGRWRRAPLYEVAVPAVRLAWARVTRRSAWVRSSLLGAGPGWDDQLPAALDGVEVFAAEIEWNGPPATAAVVRDRRAGSVSLVLPVQGAGFPVASLREQDGLLAGWGAALSPLARARCPVSRLVWQEWAHPVGVADHREFLAQLDRPTTSAAAAAAAADYDELLVCVP